MDEKEKLPHEALLDTKKPISTPGIERVIPLRFVHPRPTGSVTLSATLDAHHQGITRLNSAFRGAGIQFSLYSAEAYAMPKIAEAYRSGLNTEYNWSEVFSEFDQIPWFDVTSSSFSSINKYSPTNWMAAVTSKFGPDEAIVVWVQGQSGPSPLDVSLIGAFANGPHQSKTILVGSAWLSAQYGFAHEMGHYFNLPHTWALSALDPSTNANTKAWDWWDLIFCPSNNASVPHEYYNDRASALNSTKCGDPPGGGENAYESIDRHGGCVVNGSGGSGGMGFMNCTISVSGSPRTETKTSSDPEIKNGLGMDVSNPPSGTAAYGNNAMSYYVPGWNHPDADCYGCANLRFSASQIEMVKKVLRYEIHAKENSGNPASILWKDSDGARTKLGRKLSWQHQVSYNLDFDGDNKRDIALWEPPLTVGGTGTFHVLLSTRSWSTSSSDKLAISLGTLDSIPVLNDFNGDGRADLGVFYASGNGASNNQAYWKFCYTNSSDVFLTSCSSPTTVAFGERRDVPLVGSNFDNNTSTGEIAVYRPDTQEWFWSIEPFSSYTQRSTWQSTNTRSHAPLLNDYDLDGATDLAGYEPSSAIFYLHLASSSWNTLNKTHAMGGDFVASPGVTSFPGTQAARGGGIPIAGMISDTSGYPALGVWDVDGGKWSVAWKAGLSTSWVQNCTFGQAGDVPFGLPNKAIFTGNHSPLAYYRHIPNGNSLMSFYTGGLSTICGSGATITTSLGTLGPYTRVFPVADMSGDGKPEIIQYNPEKSEIKILSSDSYTTSTTISFGSTLSYFL